MSFLKELYCYIVTRGIFCFHIVHVACSEHISCIHYNGCSEKYSRRTGDVYHSYLFLFRFLQKLKNHRDKLAWEKNH